VDPRYVSFQSRDDPGRYLRHGNSQIWSDTSDGSDQFKLDATFELAAPLVGSDATTKSLRSFNSTTQRMLRSEASVVLGTFIDSTAYKEAATWWLAAR
jgi:non-reducing end alpha-L-arabinofuranosidase